MKYGYWMRLVCATLILTISAGFSQEKEAPDYIRFQVAATASDVDKLQTAVARFQRGDTIVDLIAAVHLADKEYFDRLNFLLRTYNVVLYEMVGGRFPAKAAQNPKGELSGVRSVQQMSTQILDLEFQLDNINYRMPNFVHADVTMAQYQRLKKEKNQNMATLLGRVIKIAESGDLAGIPAGEAAAGDFLTSLLAALSSGDSVALKRQLAPILSEAESMVALIEGEEGTVLISERNKVVIAKLKETLVKRSGQKGKIAIFYGAGHMPDLENRLIAEGFEKKKSVWIDAWNLAVKPVDPSAPPATTNVLNQLLQENPQIMSLIQQFSKAMEKAETQGN